MVAWRLRRNAAPTTTTKAIKMMAGLPLVCWSRNDPMNSVRGAADAVAVPADAAQGGSQATSSRTGTIRHAVVSQSNEPHASALNQPAG